MKSVAILPIRKGSKSIPDKNIMEIGGKPLFRWVLDGLLKSSADWVIISTDYSFQDLFFDGHTTHAYTGVELIERPSDLCQDTTPLEPVIEHALQYTDADLILIANATCPLTRAEDFDVLLGLANRYGVAGSVVNGSPFQLQREDRSSAFLDPAGRWWSNDGWPNRDEYCGVVYRMVGCGWSIGRKVFETYGSRVADGRLAPHIMPPWAIHELDEPNDIPLIEGLLEMRKAGKI